MQFKTATSGKKLLQISKSEWKSIGKRAQWFGHGTTPHDTDREDMTVDATVNDIIENWGIPKEKWGELYDLVGEAMEDGHFKRDGKYYEPLDYEIQEHIVKKLELER